MTLGIRKLIVVSLVGAVVLFANFLLVAHWLQEKGVIDMAKNVRQEFLTGTAITIIVVLLILLVRPGYSAARAWTAARHCRVCDHPLVILVILVIEEHTPKRRPNLQVMENAIFALLARICS